MKSLFGLVGLGVVVGFAANVSAGCDHGCSCPEPEAINSMTAVLSVGHVERGGAFPELNEPRVVVDADGESVVLSYVDSAGDEVRLIFDRVSSSFGAAGSSQ